MTIFPINYTPVYIQVDVSPDMHLHRVTEDTEQATAWDAPRGFKPQIKMHKSIVNQVVVAAAVSTAIEQMWVPGRGQGETLGHARHVLSVSVTSREAALPFHLLHAGTATLTSSSTVSETWEESFGLSQSLERERRGKLGWGRDCWEGGIEG